MEAVAVVVYADPSGVSVQASPAVGWPASNPDAICTSAATGVAVSTVAPEAGTTAKAGVNAAPARFTTTSRAPSASAVYGSACALVSPLMAAASAAAMAAGVLSVASTVTTKLTPESDTVQRSPMAGGPKNVKLAAVAVPLPNAPAPLSNVTSNVPALRLTMIS